ncbi:RTA1-like protein 5 [Elsinoe australis]|uniref:RTA1-like protein 5 n=1 Tax=Elsinoe australis TaxID=40998 RepID=A0A4U7AVN1_9PEZI|nr:RTA1-like protein 5 [Elsinoe australis]
MAANYHPSLNDPNAWVPYRYVPAKTPAIIFVVAFGLTTALHICQMVKNRTWYFAPLIIGGLFEIIGMIGRLLSSDDLWALGPYIMQSLLLLLAPALFAASIYIILGRIILLVDGEPYSLVPQRRLTKLFVSGDVLSFTVQMGGGGIQAAGTLALLHAGEKIIIAGLFIQLVFFGLFVIVAGLFQYRLVRNNPLGLRVGKHVTEANESVSTAGPSSAPFLLRDMPWKRHLYALYAASGLIMVRSIFRVVEYIMGNNGYLLRHKVFLYVLDATLMLFVMIIFNWIHPSEITRRYQERTADVRAEELSGSEMEMHEGPTQRR